MSGEHGELRPAYRTLNDPTRLLGVSLAGWGVLLGAGGAAYAWLVVSPLAWRVNFSLAVIVLGAPTALMLLREQSTISPGRLLWAVVRWRARPAVILAAHSERVVRQGGVRLDTPAPERVDELIEADELVWEQTVSRGGER